MVCKCGNRTFYAEQRIEAIRRVVIDDDMHIKEIPSDPSEYEIVKSDFPNATNGVYVCTKCGRAFSEEDAIHERYEKSLANGFYIDYESLFPNDTMVDVIKKKPKPRRFTSDESRDKISLIHEMRRERQTCKQIGETVGASKQYISWVLKNT